MAAAVNVNASLFTVFGDMMKFISITFRDHGNLINYSEDNNTGAHCTD